MPAFFIGFARDEFGVVAVEYALIGGLIALVIVAAITLIGSAVSARFSQPLRKALPEWLRKRLRTGAG